MKRSSKPKQKGINKSTELHGAKMRKGVETLFKSMFGADCYGAFIFKDKILFSL